MYSVTIINVYGVVNSILWHLHMYNLAITYKLQIGILIDNEPSVAYR